GDMMTISANGLIAGADGTNGGLGLANGSFYYRKIDQAQREKIQALGRRFAELTNGAPCLALIGRLIGSDDPEGSTERRGQIACEERFGFPQQEPDQTINLILDSVSWTLDTAFRTILFPSTYAKQPNS